MSILVLGPERGQILRNGELIHNEKYWDFMTQDFEDAFGEPRSVTLTQTANLPGNHKREGELSMREKSSEQNIEEYKKTNQKNF